MDTWIKVIMALLPFAVLIVGLYYHLSALRSSLYAWIIELAVVLAYYHMTPVRAAEATIWGNLVMWTGFLVLYTGQIFGQSYRNTGLLQTLLDTVEAVIPTKEGKAVSLAGIVGGFIGAFNGFATYPITIPGLVELGFDNLRSVTAYLVYFSWSVPYASLWLAPNISNAATGLPIPEIARVMGIPTIPLIFISLLGFFKILGFKLADRETQSLLWLVGMGNVIAVVLFTQIWPALYILTMIAGAFFSLILLYAYTTMKGGGAIVAAAARTAAAATAAATSPPGAAFSVALGTSAPVLATGPAAPPTTEPTHSLREVLSAYTPLALGVVIVLLTLVPSIAKALTHTQFSIGAWGYAHVTVNILTSAGFFILLTALSCYIVSLKKADPVKDLVNATRRGWDSLATLFVGSGMVYLMIDTGQIGLLGQVLASAGREGYAALIPALAFLGGMAFGQGLPGNLLFAQMQTHVAPLLHVPLVVLVGIVAIMTMGPANPVKPVLIRYSASLVGLKGSDGAIFRMAMPWQLLQVVVTAIISVILVAVWK